MDSFNFSSPGHLIFGPGKRSSLAEKVAGLGRTPLVLTGSSSLVSSAFWTELTRQLSDLGLTPVHDTIPSEPSPAMVNQIVQKSRKKGVDLVVAIGGGSVLDAGKAVSAMMTQDRPVEEFLEGIGTRTHSGAKLPFIAVPTTSGTGAEATKNAVLSAPGPQGYKKSLRHDRFIPDLVLVDPELTLSCPPGVTAACGMDALTQLLEAYVSTQFSPMTDALCQSGLDRFTEALKTAIDTPSDLAARTRLSYGAYISGLALANAGLGLVHGFAGVIGGMAENAHGQVCGTLLAAVTQANIQTLADDAPALSKYADAALRINAVSPGASIREACAALTDQLNTLTAAFKMPNLSQCGITKEMLPEIVRKTGQKNNPVRLPEKTLLEILNRRF